MTLNNVAEGVTTPPETTKAAPTSSAAAPSSSAAAPTSATVTTPIASSSSEALAETGTRTQIGASLWFGIALVLLGLVLLFEGRVRRIVGKHNH